jgi:hypothetical protein
LRYITLQLNTDAEDLMEEAFDFLRARIPGWEPSDAQLDVWLIQAMSSAAAELRDVASAVPDTIYRYLGILAGIPPLDETSATGYTTWTVVDTTGHTIPAGTQVGLRDPGGNLIEFTTMNTVVIPPGSATSGIGEIVISATLPGSTGSGLGSVGAEVELVDVLDYVSAVHITDQTTGGQDAEADSDYLDRLSSELALLAPRPILPSEFAVFARQVAGVFRAVGIDGYNPADGTFNNERMVAVATMDSSGANVSSAVKAAVDADLQARRELNFVVNVIDFSRTEVDVTYTVKMTPGSDPAVVISGVNAALSAYLNPAAWGTLPNSDPKDFVNTPVLRYLEVAQVINSVDGVDYITTTGGNYDLLIGVHGGAMGRQDVALPGPTPVPHANTLTGTAT